jgi:hypothetical protein
MTEDVARKLPSQRVDQTVIYLPNRLGIVFIESCLGTVRRSSIDFTAMASLVAPRRGRR